MRPARFAPFLGELVAADGQDTAAVALADVGYTACPYGLVLRVPSGALVYLQVVTVSSTGHSVCVPERPVHGPAPVRMSEVVLPGAGLTALTNVERYLGALLTGPQCAEVRGVELFADRERPGAVPHGLTVWFHCGERAYVYARHCVTAGRELGHGARPFHRLDRV